MLMRLVLATFISLLLGANAAQASIWPAGKMPAFFRELEAPHNVGD